MKIAIVGSGIAGLTAAHLLHRRHDVTVFETDKRVGGHTNTVEVATDDGTVSVDTGFIVYNDRNYPGFSSLLRELQVDTQPAAMSFSVSCARTGLQYSGRNLSGLFAQRGNAASLPFLRMIGQVLRFNRRAVRDIEGEPQQLTLGAYLDKLGYSGLFRSHYLVPMAAAIWSAPPSVIEAFPAHLFVEFFKNHGLLTVNDQPQWRSIVGGSRRYVNKLIEPFGTQLRLGCGVRRVTRELSRVLIHSPAGAEYFDQVIIACHSDQALSLLGDPSPRELAILGALPYQRNEAVLHDDINQLPKNRRAWAAWNYSIPKSDDEPPHVTYLMNLLQELDTRKSLCVTLNATDQIPSTRRIAELIYEHPVYTPESQLARSRRKEINGMNRTWFCGAYWGYGFHEDGFQSGSEIAGHIEETRKEAA